jgi:hypothetical protein
MKGAGYTVLATDNWHQAASGKLLEMKVSCLLKTDS